MGIELVSCLRAMAARRGASNQHVGFEAHQFCCKFRKCLGSPFSGPKLDPQVTTFFVALLTQHLNDGG